LEKPGENEFIRENALAMVQCKLLKQIQLLEGKKIDDPELIDDRNFINDTLTASVQDLRSDHDNCQVKGLGMSE